MGEIDDLIHDAWARIQPLLEQDQHELARRLQRRRTPTLTRPPRAWCLALRASDHRIPTGLREPAEHQVTLTAEQLRRLTDPVHLSQEYLDEAAQKLGTSPAGLTHARIAGVITADHYPGIGGRRGRPIPLFSTDRHRPGLDPNARLFTPPDPAWSWTAPSVSARIPAHLNVTLTRIPHFRSHVSKHRYDDTRHPELDGVCPSHKSKRLPQPLEDPACWYKWSRAGHYLGNDPSNWRKHPDDLGLRPRRDLPKRKRTCKPKPSQSAGSEHFNGFHWLCPTCNKKARVLYLPLPPINLLETLRDSSFRLHPSSFPLPPLPRLAKLVDIPRKLEGFACFKCHRIDYFSRCSPKSWNRLIAYLTQGLLYGHEVPRPDWLTRDRKRQYKPRPGRAPSKRREQILRLIQVGAPNAAIAKALGISRLVVINHLHRIYKEHNVINRAALAEKLGCLTAQKVPRPRFGRNEILPHLMAGKTLKQIATETGVKYASIASAAMRAYKMHGVKDREAFAQATNSPLPPPNLGPRPSRRRDEIARRLAAGQPYEQIAREMNITYGSVGTAATKIYRLHGVCNRAELAHLFPRDLINAIALQRPPPHPNMPTPSSAL